MKKFIAMAAMLMLAACAASGIQDLGVKQNLDGTVTEYRGVTAAPENGPVQVRIEARTYSVDGTVYKKVGETEVTATGGNSLGHDLAVGAMNIPAAIAGGVALGKTMPKAVGATATSTACQSQATSGTAGNNNC